MLQKNEDGSYAGTPEEVHVAVTKLLNSRIPIMQKCLTMAHEAVIALLAAPHVELDGRVAKDTASMFTVIQTHIGREMTEDEKLDVAYGITMVFSKGYSPCDLWTIAHEFEHEFYPDESEAPPVGNMN